MKDTLQLIIQYYIKSIKKDQVPKKMHISQQVDQHINHLQMHKRFKQLFKLDAQVFLYALTQVQDVYTYYFQDQFFNTVEQHDVLDDRVNLNWFNDELYVLITDFIKQFLGTAKGLMFDLVIDQLNFKDLIKQLNCTIVQLFNDSADNLRKMVQEFIISTDQSLLVNKFLIMGLFQELSSRCYDLVYDFQDYSVFNYSSQEQRELFSRFVIHNFDIIQLYINRNDDQHNTHQTQVQQLLRKHSISTLEETEVIELILSSISNKDAKVVIHKIVHKQSRRKGLLVELGQEKSLIIHKPCDRLVVTSARLASTRWMFEEALHKMSPEELMERMEEGKIEYNSLNQAFNSLKFQAEVTQLSETEFDIRQEQIAFVSGNMQTNQVQNAFGDTIEHAVAPIRSIQPAALPMYASFGDIGATLGMCLANVNKYKSRRQFLTDFGSTAAINGSITYIATQMPIIGQLIALGGLGYFTMKIYTNDNASSHSKNAQMNKLMIGTTANIGSGIGGALIGQALIPVPILGALIGGLIGGLVGGTSSALLLEYMTNRRFLALQESLMETQLDGCWEYSIDMLGQFGLSRQCFLEFMPNNLRFDEERDKKWINMIAYTYLTVYQQQQDILKLKDQDESEQKELLEEEFPMVIENSIRWIIQNRCLIGLALGNLENSIRCIFSNL